MNSNSSSTLVPMSLAADARVRPSARRLSRIAASCPVIRARASSSRCSSSRMAALMKSLKASKVLAPNASAPSITISQPSQQLSTFPAGQPGPYPGSGSRLRCCCSHAHMIDRREQRPAGRRISSADPPGRLHLAATRQTGARGDGSGRGVGVLHGGREVLGALLRCRRIHPRDLPAVAVEVEETA